MSETYVVVGMAVTGQAVCKALAKRGESFVAVDDKPKPDAQEMVTSLGGQFIEAPSRGDLVAVLDGAAAMLPTPGLPERHIAFDVAAEVGTKIKSEFDLAQSWDDRPLLAITGTNGKTTVTEWTTQMLNASGKAAVAVGNTDTPLVEAIDDPMTDVFVVEASSFRLAQTDHFTPRAATWLNFAPDHLDIHKSLGGYEAAKARIFTDQTADDVAILNADDPIVMRNRPTMPIVKTVGSSADYRVEDGKLVAEGETLCGVDQLWRSLPHDCFDALAAAATATVGGATLDGIVDALESFQGLAHRVEFVAEHHGVRYFNDSKATTPHAVAAAVSGFDRVVLIAGGKNKGIDLSPIADNADHIASVVAIGDSANDVVDIFDGVRPVEVADSMESAVALAAQAAEPGEVVLLSPGCASFDWYENYGARGRDFTRIVLALAGGNK